MTHRFARYFSCEILSVQAMSVPTKFAFKESSEPAKLGFEGTAKVEAQVPKQVAGECSHKQQQRTIGRFECDVTGCHKVYNRKDNLALHMQRAHCIHPKKAGRFKCNVSGCTETFYHRVKLITHLKTEHGVDVGKK